MRTIFRIALLAALAAAAFIVASAQNVPTRNGNTVVADRMSDEIKKLEQERDQAFLRPTAEAIERFHTEDLRLTARARVSTRADMIARIGNPAFPPGQIESLNSVVEDVRVYGDTAVAAGTWKRVSKSADGKDTSADGHFTHVWVKRNGVWKIAVAHYSPSIATLKARQLIN